MVSPLVISIAIHYHTTVGDFRDGDFDAPAVREALELLVDNGLLKVKAVGLDNAFSYKATDGLAAWIDGLRSVPFPKLTWVIDFGRIGE